MNVADDTSTLIVWRISDGRAGHETQSSGLIRAIEKFVECVCHDVQALNLFEILINGLFHQPKSWASLPSPDLIIGAGHKTHISMLYAKRMRGGKTIVLMKPGLPTNYFDYCLIPSHDNPGVGKNILLTQGALNTITPSTRHDPKRGLILVGGVSRHYAWDNENLIQQIQAVVERTNCFWQVSDSPRTPVQTRKSLQTLVDDRLHYVPFQDSDRSWLPEQLQFASVVWVTEDSISMIYEALTAGTSVGVLHVPIKKYGRIPRAVETLANNKIICKYEAWMSGEQLSPANPPLNEAARCAEWLLSQSSLLK